VLQFNRFVLEEIAEINFNISNIFYPVVFGLKQDNLLFQPSAIFFLDKMLPSIHCLWNCLNLKFLLLRAYELEQFRQSVIGYGLDDWCSIPGRSRDFSLFHYPSG
jgi:hypothetical protein